MFPTDQEENVMLESRDALNRLHESKKVKDEKSLKTLKENFHKFDRGRDHFEEFDEVTYEGKVKVDMLFYEQFLQKLDNPEIVQEALIALYKDIYSIYEFINVKPDIYGNGVTLDILNDSAERTRNVLSKVIYDYFDRTFYSLDAEQRKEKYYDEHKELAKKLISEGTSPEEAIAFSTKTIVMENLLKNISFPFSTWSRIKYLRESDDYGAVFDQDKLKTLVESFEKKIKGIAKIVASCV